jgi:3-oxoacyl-[acyl-carrier protein] reductase
MPPVSPGDRPRSTGDAGLDGRVAVVTGGATGLGLAMASGLAADGAFVALVDIEGDRAAEAASDLRAAGRRAWGGTCDVSSAPAVRATMARIRDQLGPVAILVNNAGLYEGYTHGFATLTDDEIHRLFAVNVHGVINCTMACADDMRRRGGGVVVHIASDAGFHSRHPYGVTKLAVRGLTVALATELAPDAIRVNAIAPGLIGTAHALAHVGAPETEERVVSRQLLKRLGTTEDIVAALRFLVGDGAAFITGQTVRVNGGIDLVV